jgi:TolA-binding protein
MKLRFFPNLTKFCCRIKLFWLILAGIMLVLSIDSCSAPRNYKNKLKGTSLNKSLIKEINTNSNEIDDKVNDNSYVNNDYTYIDEIKTNDNSKKSTVAGISNYHFSTLEEQLKQINNNQEKTNIRLDGIETEINNLKQEISVINDGMNISDKNNDKLQDNSKKRHRIQSSKSIILSDEEEGINDELIHKENKQYPEKNFNDKKNTNSKSSLNKNEYIVNSTKSVKTGLNQIKSHKPLPIKNSAIKNQVKGNEKHTKIITENKTQNQNISLTENLAMKYFTTQEYDKAIGEFNKSVQNEKDAAKINKINYYIGESYFGLRQWDKAVIYFDQVINSSNINKKAEAQVMIAEAHIRSGQTFEAKKAFQALIEQYPKSNYIPRARKMLQML